MFSPAAMSMVERRIENFKPPLLCQSTNGLNFLCGEKIIFSDGIINKVPLFFL